MDAENKVVDETVSGDVIMQSPAIGRRSISPKKRFQDADIDMKSPASGRTSLSPRKRAFREINNSEEQTTKAESGKTDDVTTEKVDVEEPVCKRHKFQRTQEEYPSACTAHVLWNLDTGSDPGALLVEEKQIILGLADGRVVFCDMEGTVTSQIPLSRPVGALFRQGGRLLAWCRGYKGYETWKGALVDLSFECPQTLYDIEDFGHLFLHAAMVDGCLALADDKGNVGMFGCDGEAIWKKEQLLIGDGKFFHADESGVYVAHKKVVRCYGVKDGEIIWEYTSAGGRHASIAGGYEKYGYLYIQTTSGVVRLDKVTGECTQEFSPYRHQAAGACVGSGVLITGNNPTVIFELETGLEIYRMYIPARLDLSIIQFPSNRRLYTFWDKLYCINMTDEGLKGALEGKYARTYNKKMPPPPEDLKENKTGTLPASGSTQGIVVSCDQEASSAGLIKAHVTAEGYNADWPVLLPRDMREKGRNFVVEKLERSVLGQFYRVTGGEIFRLDHSADENTNDDVTSGETAEADVNDVNTDKE